MVRINLEIAKCRDFLYIPTMDFENLTSVQLRKAADLIEKIAELQNELIALGGSASGIPSPFKSHQAAKSGGRKMSPAHKAKIRAAQKVRWSKVKTAKTQPAALKPAKRRKMSAAGRAAVAAAARARWAKVRADRKA